MSITAIIQARMGSTRLPGKVLLPIVGYPMLWHVVTRVAAASLVNTVVVATSDEPADDAIAYLCKTHNWTCYRGSELDVLDRYYQAATATGSKTIVRITSDCPLISTDVVNDVVLYHLSQCSDYTSNTLAPRTFPRGLDVEVFSYEALRQAWQEDDDQLGWREHVTPYLYRHPERFKLAAWRNTTDHSHLRWTVDTPEDLSFVRTVLESLGQVSPTWDVVLAYVLENPMLTSINDTVVQKHLLI